MYTCLHCGQPMAQGVGFCGKCGKQAGTAPPPKPRRFCQSCGVELADGIQFCQGCGNKAPGAGFNLPSGVNLDSAKKLAGRWSIHIQRLALIAASVLGLLGCLLPWYGIRFGGATRLTVNAFRAKAPGFGNEIHAFGLIVVLLFTVSLALCFLYGNRAEPVVGNFKFFFAGVGGLNLLIGISRFFSEGFDLIRNAGGSVWLGLFLVILASAAITAIPFVKQLEK